MDLKCVLYNNEAGEKLDELNKETAGMHEEQGEEEAFDKDANE